MLPVYQEAAAAPATVPVPYVCVVGSMSDGFPRDRETAGD